MAQFNFTFESVFRKAKQRYIEIFSAGDSADSNWNYEHSPHHEAKIAKIALDFYSQNTHFEEWEYEPVYDEITDKITGYSSHLEYELDEFIFKTLGVRLPTIL